MRSVPETGGKSKIGGWKNRGRHGAPSLAGKIGRLVPVAGLGTLAVVGLGVLASTPGSQAGHDATALHAQAASLLTTNRGQDASSATPLRVPHQPNIMPSAHLSAAAAHRKRHHHQQQPQQPQQQHAVAAASQSPAPSKAAVSCSANASGPLPANYAAIVTFLLAHGYTGNAAAGIAGNIYQESGGNPESIGSGGGGLIGWTPLPGGYVTGNPSADLQTQLNAILSFNQIWAQYIPALNAAASPAQAADIYVTDFERAGIPAASNREAAAQAVAAACGI